MSNTLTLTAAQMIDIASMKAIYAHLHNDPEIENALQVHGQEKDLAEIGQWMIEGNVDACQKATNEGRITLYKNNSIPITNSILCLYLPPFYLFIDLKRKHQ